jgi:hypothetical protein
MSVRASLRRLALPRTCSPFCSFTATFCASRVPHVLACARPCSPAAPSACGAHAGRRLPKYVSGLRSICVYDAARLKASAQPCAHRYTRVGGLLDMWRWSGGHGCQGRCGRAATRGTAGTGGRNGRCDTTDGCGRGGGSLRRRHTSRCRRGEACAHSGRTALSGTQRPRQAAQV